MIFWRKRGGERAAPAADTVDAAASGAVAEADGSSQTPIAASVDAVAAGARVRGQENDPDVTAGSGTCSDWRTWSDASFKPFQHTRGFPKSGDATCCSLTATDVLCRKPIMAEHVVGATYGESLVGIRRGASAPWIDVPVEVRRHESMRFEGPMLVRLKLTTNGRQITLAVSEGSCPRACSRTPAGCRLAEADANRACDAVGTYLAGDSKKRPSAPRNERPHRPPRPVQGRDSGSCGPKESLEAANSFRGEVGLVFRGARSWRSARRTSP